MEFMEGSFATVFPLIWILLHALWRGRFRFRIPKRDVDSQSLTVWMGIVAPFLDTGKISMSLPNAQTNDTHPYSPEELEKNGKFNYIKFSNRILTRLFHQSKTITKIFVYILLPRYGQQCSDIAGIGPSLTLQTLPSPTITLLFLRVMNTPMSACKS